MPCKLLCIAVLQRNEKQIEGIRRACRLGREILDKAHRMIKPGVTTDEIDKAVSLLTKFSTSASSIPSAMLPECTFRFNEASTSYSTCWAYKKGKSMLSELEGPWLATLVQFSTLLKAWWQCHISCCWGETSHRPSPFFLLKTLETVNLFSARLSSQLVPFYG